MSLKRSVKNLLIPILKKVFLKYREKGQEDQKQAFFDENYFYQSGFPLFFRISTYNSPIGLTFIPLCRI